ncbi:fimbrial protein [Klebsiella aerogenes]
MNPIVRSFHSVMLPSILALLVMGQCFSEAGAAEHGHGRVNMQGSIIDTPCAIDVNSRDQTIDMAVIPVGQIIRDNHGPERAFHIRLINCTLTPLRPNSPDWSKFRITFDGPSTGQNLFRVSGDARGVGLQIADTAGAVAIPGEAMPAAELLIGNMQLNYTLRLMSNREHLRAGAYRTTIRFKLDYF